AGRLSDLHITSDVTVQQVGLLMGGETIDQVKATRSESI
ncbi:MAG: hypothetical protein ACI9JP_001284, partial [Granulosicoccus sp.]